EFLRQHGDDGADEVGGVAAALGLLVEGGARVDVGGDVGDVHADAGLAVGQLLDGEGVVEVLGVVGVDGEGGDVAVVAAALELVRLHGVGEVGDFGLHGLGEGRVEVVFAVDAEEFGAGLEGFAEDLGDLALEDLVAVGPLVEFDHDLVADGGRGGQAGGVGRVADGDLVEEAGVIDGDIPGAADAAQ